MYARMYDCGQIGIRTHDHDKRTNGTQDTKGREETTGKGRNTGKHKNKIYYCCEIYTQKMKKS